jgi:hypothetical protein
VHGGALLLAILITHSLIDWINFRARQHTNICRGDVARASGLCRTSSTDDYFFSSRFSSLRKVTLTCSLVIIVFDIQIYQSSFSFTLVQQ